MHIQWKPDRNHPATLQDQIKQYMLDRIAKGDWPLETKLPPERQMATAFQVNRSTLVTVLDDLKAQGLLEGRGRKGTFVVNNSWSLLTSSAQPDWATYIDQGIHAPNQWMIQQINHLEFTEDIIRLGTGEPSPALFPKDLMAQVMEAVSKEITHLGYEEPKGNIRLRRAIATDLKRFGMDVPVDQIMIVSGSLQAFSLIARSILQPNSSIYTERPSYVKSLNVFQSAGMRLDGIEMDDWGISLGHLEKRMKKSGTNLLYTIPTFHNPTGVLMPLERRRDLLELAGRLQLPIIEDDAYRDLWLDEEPPIPLKAMDTSGNVIYIGSLSKSYAPGIRIGWVVGPQPIVDRLGDIKMQTDYGASSLSQLVAAKWLEDGYHLTYQKRLRRALIKRRDLVLSILENRFSDLATWSRPSGGFYVWLQLNQAIDQQRLFQRLLEDRILINPGNIYDYGDTQAIRLSYAYADEEEIRHGLPILADCIRELSQA